MENSPVATGLDLMYRFPAGPPWGEGSPLPARRIFFAFGQSFGNTHFNGVGGRALTDGDGFFSAVNQFFQGQWYFIFDIFARCLGMCPLLAESAARVLEKRVPARKTTGSAPGAGLAERRRKSSPAAAESEFLENISQIEIFEDIFLGIALLKIGGTIGVILFSFFRVTENGIGLTDFLELVL